MESPMKAHHTMIAALALSTVAVPGVLHAEGEVEKIGLAAPNR